LTDFEEAGYVLMINNRKTNIGENYKEIITSEKAQYIPNTLRIHPAMNGTFTYFQTSHRFGPIEKQIIILFSTSGRYGEISNKEFTRPQA
jgi:hypothetical protein